MDLNETYYHPTLLLIPGLPLILFGLIATLTNAQDYLLWVVIAEGVICLFLLIDIMRVRRYVEGQGAKLISMKWAPFGPGWFSLTRRNATIYQIETAKPLSTEVTGHVRVSLWFGVEPTD